jgi:lysophospholipase L1-like esterase
MENNSKLFLVFLLISILTQFGLLAKEAPGLLENFEFQGQKYSLYTVFSPANATLILQGKTGKNLSAEMPGENILLGTKFGSDNFYVFWLNYRKKTVCLTFYDFRRNRSQALPLAGFSFIALPEIIEANNDLQGLVFLGNRSDNDDLFYYEPGNDLLMALTATPFSEKGFTLLEKDGQLEIVTRSLWAQYRYGFDPGLRKCFMVEEKPFSARANKNAAAMAPDYYNTYIGFGDSITWGEIDGEQHLESCYLTQMQALLADPGYVNYYGAASSVNLGVPGDNTWAGAQRIDQDLASHSGFYFLLMLGFNDIPSMNFSIDSSLENLAYIIDAAKAHGMRIIASTPTPSKYWFSRISYYWNNLRNLSSGIIALAKKKNIVSIDSLSAFMNTNPPEGWKNLLEDTANGGSGNHPNATGHQIIASLFTPALVNFPPQAPQNIRVVDPLTPRQRTVSWNVNTESDFSHFHVTFGFQPQALDYSLDATASYCTIPLYPFLPQLYFRIQTVDRGNRQSGSSTPDAAAAVIYRPSNKTNKSGAAGVKGE